MRRYSDGRETRLVVAMSISFRQPLSGQMIDGTRGVLPCTAFLSYYIYTLLLVISLLCGARWDHDQSESRDTTPGSAAESVV